MATMTVAFDPKVDTHESVVSIIDSIYILTPSAPAEPTSDETTEGLPNGWTRKRLRKYLLNVTETGLKALRVIADEAPKTTFDHVQKEMGFDSPSKYGGMMSTFGHAVNATPGVTDRPFFIDYGTRTYQMDEALAALTIELLDEMGY